MSARKLRSVGRLLSEGVLIVLSILLAFALDAWWDGLQELREETDILRRLEVETSANLDQLLEKRTRHEEARDAATALLEFTGPRESLAVGQDSIARLITRLASYWTYDPGNGVLSSLLNSDKLRLLRNESLRTELAGWPALVDDIQEDEQEAWRVVNERITPFLDRYVAWRTLSHSLGEVLEPSAFPNDIVALLREREFENIVDGKRLTEETILLYYGPLQESVERSLRLIRSELETSR
jgi:hypothetical protein